MVSLLLAVTIGLAAAAVGLPSSTSCPVGSFNDTSGRAQAICVGGTYHLFCPDSAILATDWGPQPFAHLIFLGGGWVGFRSEGGVAGHVLLVGVTPTVSCPVQTCEHSCSFGNPGGLEPLTTCEYGNPVKSCLGGKLFIGDTPHHSATCLPSGKWVAWTLSGFAISLPDKLEASCTRVNCRSVAPLTASHLVGSAGLAIDDSQQVVTNGTRGTANRELKCAAGTKFAYHNGTALVVGDEWISCDDSAEDGWQLQGAAGSHLGYFGYSAAGCVKSACPALDLLSAADAAVANETALQLDEAGTTVDYAPSDSRFMVECSAGFHLGWMNEDGKRITMDEGASLTCEPQGWTKRSATDAAGSPLGTSKVGCFKRLACPPLLALTQAHAAAGVGAALEPRGIAATTGNWSELVCPPGSVFAFYNGSRLQTREPGGWMSCSSTRTDGWRIRDAAYNNLAYDNFPVGCIKPSCAPLTEIPPALVYKAYYQKKALVPGSITYSGGRFRFSCPEPGFRLHVKHEEKNLRKKGLTFHYGWTSSRCEAKGWWGDGYASRQITRDVACLPTYFAWSGDCHVRSLLPSDLTAFPTSVVDTKQQRRWFKNSDWEFKCAAGTPLAWAKEGTVQLENEKEVEVSCRKRTWDWRTRSISGAPPRNRTMLDRFGCLKPACPNLLSFNGTEPFVDTAKLKLVPTRPALIGNQWYFECPEGASAGYESQPSVFTNAPGMRLQCTRTGWMVVSSGEDFDYRAAKIGCFNGTLLNGTFPQSDIS